jgi:hypothetical protein
MYIIMTTSVLRAVAVPSQAFLKAMPKPGCALHKHTVLAFNLGIFHLVPT